MPPAAQNVINLQADNENIRTAYSRQKTIIVISIHNLTELKVIIIIFHPNPVWHPAFTDEQTMAFHCYGFRLCYLTHSFGAYGCPNQSVERQMFPVSTESLSVVIIRFMRSLYARYSAILQFLNLLNVLKYICHFFTC